MSNKRYWIEESCLTNMADIIRHKTGMAEKLTFPDEFLEGILNIETTPLTTLPVLDSNYPEDITVFESASISANFVVSISVPGVPAEYTYQWYMDGVAIEGANNSFWQFNGNKAEGVYSVYCEVKNEAGTVISRISKLIVESCLPEFTYSGTYELKEDGNYNWRIKFLTSGTFTPIKTVDNIDVFCVGGGAGSASGLWAAGGGGGYTTTKKAVSIEEGVEYTVTVGAGGSAGGNAGGTSSFGDLASAAGGGSKTNIQSGGSGGGGSGKNGPGGNGGSNGSAGSDGYNGAAKGSGQGTTTREFGLSDGTLYSGGGGGATDYAENYEIPGTGGAGGGGRGSSPNRSGTAGSTNTGGGGGGGSKAGGSGIVIIRNAR